MLTLPFFMSLTAGHTKFDSVAAKNAIPITSFTYTKKNAGNTALDNTAFINFAVYDYDAKWHDSNVANGHPLSILLQEPRIGSNIHTVTAEPDKIPNFEHFSFTLVTKQVWEKYRNKISDPVECKRLAYEAILSAQIRTTEHKTKVENEIGATINLSEESNQIVVLYNHENGMIYAHHNLSPNSKIPNQPLELQLYDSMYRLALPENFKNLDVPVVALFVHCGMPIHMKYALQFWNYGGKAVEQFSLEEQNIVGCTTFTLLIAFLVAVGIYSYHFTNPTWHNALSQLIRGTALLSTARLCLFKHSLKTYIKRGYGIRPINIICNLSISLETALILIFLVTSTYIGDLYTVVLNLPTTTRNAEFEVSRNQSRLLDNGFLIVYSFCLFMASLGPVLFAPLLGYSLSTNIYIVQFGLLLTAVALLIISISSLVLSESYQKKNPMLLLLSIYTLFKALFHIGYSRPALYGFSSGTMIMANEILNQFVLIVSFWFLNRALRYKQQLPYVSNKAL